MTQHDNHEKPVPRSGRRRFKKDAAKRMGLTEPTDGDEERAAIVRRIACEMREVSVDGRKERLSMSELVLLKLRNMAIEGNPRAARAWTKHLETYAPQISNQDAAYLVVPPELTPEEWAAAVEKHNRKADARRAKELEQKEQHQKELREKEARPPKQL